MHTNRKWTALFLALCLTFPALAGCGETETVAETTADTAAADTVAAEEAETRPMHAVPETDFGGEEFRTYYLYWQGHRFYFFAEEETGDAMNDAIWERTLRVEEFLNVKLSQDYTDNYDTQTNTIKSLVQAGDDQYQQALIHCIKGVSELSSGGYLYNLDKVPSIDITKPWWNQTQMDVLRLGNNTYYGVSDYMIPCPYVMYFNKDMVTEAGLEDPYQLVYEGKWTLDAMIDMIEAVVRDTNGDGNIDHDDIWGMCASEYSKYISFTTGADQFMTTRDDAGRVEMAMNTDRMYAIIEKIYQVASMPGGAYTPASHKVEDMIDFGGGHLLFRLDALATAVEFRDLEINIGILPYPKFDEAQENYVSQDWGGLMCVPTTIQNPEMVGSVIELLAYFSEETVIPAYYDVTLDGKIARDEDTIAMLDIIFDTIAYEIGGNYFGFSNGFTNLFYTTGFMVVRDKSTDFASFYAKNEKPALKVIDDFYTDLEKVESQG